MNSITDKYNAQQKIIKQELLEMIQNLLKKDLDKESRQTLEEMRKAVKTNKFEGLNQKIYEQYNAQGWNIPPNSGRQNFSHIFIEKVMDLVSIQHKYQTDPDSPQQKYSSEANLKVKIKELLDEFEQQEKSMLMARLAQATILLELLSNEVDHLKFENKFLRFNYVDNLLKKRKTVKSQTAGKVKKFSTNNKCLEECLNEILSAGAVDKIISKKIYARFCNLVKKKYPTPPYVQKPRLSREEKRQDPAIQAVDREALKRNEWAPTTLRTFFEKALKIRITDLPNK